MHVFFGNFVGFGDVLLPEPAIKWLWCSTCAWCKLFGVRQADANRALNGVTKQTERGPVVTFTIDDQDQVMTVEEVGKISSAEFQRLYSV
jgi:hypothetical protein